MTSINNTVDFFIVDDQKIKQLQEKKKRIDRVMQVIHEHGLDQDQKFMHEIDNLMKELLKEE